MSSVVYLPAGDCANQRTFHAMKCSLRIKCLISEENQEWVTLLCLQSIKSSWRGHHHSGWSILSGWKEAFFVWDTGIHPKSHKTISVFIRQDHYAKIGKRGKKWSKPCQLQLHLLVTEMQYSPMSVLAFSIVNSWASNLV